MSELLSYLREPLAKLCGFCLHDPGRIIAVNRDQVECRRCEEMIDRKVYFEQMSWAPQEDVAQAIRCLQALGIEWSWTIRRMEVSITNIIRTAEDTLGNPTHLAFTDSIPQNICLALASALGIERSGG